VRSLMFRHINSGGEHLVAMLERQRRFSESSDDDSEGGHELEPSPDAGSADDR